MNVPFSRKANFCLDSGFLAENHFRQENRFPNLLTDDRIQFQGWMIFLLKKWKNLFFGDPHGLIGDPVEEVGYAHFFAPFEDAIFDLFLQGLGHPDHP